LTHTHLTSVRSAPLDARDIAWIVLKWTCIFIAVATVVGIYFGRKRQNRFNYD
jgi:ABC-type polysaccharide/polyol phosphate export permease